MLNEKAVSSPPPTNYGNMPLEVSQSGSTPPGEEGKKSKFEEQGKKFGKKMGNAGTFKAMRIRSPYRLMRRTSLNIRSILLIITSSYLRCRCYDGFEHCQQHLLGAQADETLFSLQFSFKCRPERRHLMFLSLTLICSWEWRWWFTFHFIIIGKTV